MHGGEKCSLDEFPEFPSYQYPRFSPHLGHAPGIWPYKDRPVRPPGGSDKSRVGLQHPPLSRLPTLSGLESHTSKESGERSPRFQQADQANISACGLVLAHAHTANPINPDAGLLFAPSTLHSLPRVSPLGTKFG